ncbi:MAG: hypothetical protein KKF12_12175 [Proteobacteria bacterium]|nr:hypothetical protein [Pseudomonadota bacterium]MBU4131569.1 hypothetical protein [Pseudomonadota bacterium]
MSDPEKVWFEKCEGIIKRGLNTFLEVGQALAEIRDNRLYRETHKDWPHYCKDVWDLTKRYADMQIQAHETVILLESKWEQLFPFQKTDPETPQSESEEKCTDCEYRKAMANKAKGIKIGMASGKCTRPEGLCEKHSQPASPPIQQEIILPINEAQTRPLTTLSPDDQVKAWGLVLEQLNAGKKLTASLVSKAVKGVKGEAVKERFIDTKKKVEGSPLVSNQFKRQYQVLLDIISDERNNGWKNMKRTEVVKHLKSMIKIVESDD